jgi:hypothetical protein
LSQDILRAFFIAQIQVSASTWFSAHIIHDSVKSATLKQLGEPNVAESTTDLKFIAAKTLVSLSVSVKYKI